MQFSFLVALESSNSNHYVVIGIVLMSGIETSTQSYHRQVAEGTVDTTYQLLHFVSRWIASGCDILCSTMETMRLVGGSGRSDDFRCMSRLFK